MAATLDLAIITALVSLSLTWSFVLGKPSRSSDPSAFPIQDSVEEQPYDPATLPQLPLGQPDSLENDIPGEPLNPDEFNSMEDIQDDNSGGTTSDFDAILMAGLFQGDIQLNTRAELAFLTQGTGKNAIKDMEERWPNGVIPYVISSSYNIFERNRIAAAMKKFHEKTCIKFVPRSTEKDYIHILKGDGCSSNVGMVGGAQALSLGPGCVHVGIAIHEMMHAAGFWHEQSRFDRDDYIYIDYSNIKDGMEYNFEKYGWDFIQNLGVEYDIGSIMHYGKNAFAKDRNRPTIIPLRGGSDMGQRRDFSEKDLEKLYRLYQCSNTSHSGYTQAPSVTTTSAPVTGSCKDNHRYCSEWSQTGECQRNPVWMKANCGKSCHQCDCIDAHQYCYEWSMMGECLRNAPYMRLYCQQSCGLCGGSYGASMGDSGTKCEDMHKHCSAWAQEGQCKSNSKYMKKKCAKSCGKC